jgi:hypothetical protein
LFPISLQGAGGCGAGLGPDDGEAISTLATWLGLWDAYVLPNITYFDQPEQLPELLRRLAEDARHAALLSDAMTRFWTTAGRVVQVKPLILER